MDIRGAGYENGRWVEVARDYGQWRNVFQVYIVQSDKNVYEIERFCKTCEEPALWLWNS